MLSESGSIICFCLISYWGVSILVSMIRLLTRIRRKNSLLKSVLKCIHHSLFICAFVYLTMCPVVHEIGNGFLDHAVITYRVNLYKIISKDTKNISRSGHHVDQLFSMPGALMHTKISHLVSYQYPPVLCANRAGIATTRLIL